MTLKPHDLLGCLITLSCVPPLFQSDKVFVTFCPLSWPQSLPKRVIPMRDIFSYLSLETICCDASSEPSHRDGSDKGSQHMFLCRTDRKYH